MNFANIIFDISRDANPIEPGFQPSPIYIASCLIIPIVVGIIAGIFSSLIVKLLDKYFNNANGSNNR